MHWIDKMVLAEKGMENVIEILLAWLVESIQII